MIRGRHCVRGFTLLEVLVAVAVLGIAMAAVISAMARQADNAGYLKQKTLALWVAHNRLAEIQLQAKAPATGRSDGKAEMGGFEWKWEAVVQTTEDPRLRRIDIVVRRPEDPKGSLAQLNGFLAVPPP
ncbi:MAG: gspI [Panacagrimonas sp.]|jgi:general secretion pathway protein I|nr:type II secretion system minor pseudopilin GspI [Panacagrimonas sp.]MCC2658450.1 gspI [Panacagrimonas sp.]